MSITAERKHELISEYGAKQGDTGSPDVQVAVLSERISNLTEHFKTHVKTTIRAAGSSSSCRKGGVCSITSRPTTRSAMNR